MQRSMPMATFIRNYANVLDDAEATEDSVVLERRAGRASFVISPFRRAEADRHAVGAVTHVLGRALINPAAANAIARGMLDEFPWVSFLPPEEQDRFQQEILQVLRACANIGRYLAFENLVESWRASAEVWSDPVLARALQGSVDAVNGADVPRPPPVVRSTHLMD